MFNVLIVEDDKNIRKLIEIKLNNEGYKTVTAENGKDALEKLSENHVDIMLVDAMMPIMDGYEFVKTVRSEGNIIPAIMVTARGTLSDKSMGFDVGVDDYIVKPIEFDELFMRIKAVMRRAKIVTERKIMVGSTVLDYDTMTVISQGEEVILPRKEFNILFKLLSFPNKIFTRTQLMDEFWGLYSESLERTVDVHITRLRDKFKSNTDFSIQTVRGLGYKAVKNV